MLRTASSLPLFTGPSTLGFDPARLQTKPPACYRASWQLPGPDFHRQATTSLRTARSTATSRLHLLLCWAHEITSLNACQARLATTPKRSRQKTITAAEAVTEAVKRRESAARGRSLAALSHFVLTKSRFR